MKNFIHGSTSLWLVNGNSMFTVWFDVWKVYAVYFITVFWITWWEQSVTTSLALVYLRITFGNNKDLLGLALLANLPMFECFWILRSWENSTITIVYMFLKLNEERLFVLCFDLWLNLVIYLCEICWIQSWIIACQSHRISLMDQLTCMADGPKPVNNGLYWFQKEQAFYKYFMKICSSWIWYIHIYNII